jgi:hypothetical protein
MRAETSSTSDSADVPVALYSATIHLEVEQSSLEWDPAIDAATREAAIKLEPNWTPHGWRPSGFKAGEELTGIALKKLKRSFELYENSFTEEADGQKSYEIRDYINRRWPSIAEQAGLGFMPGDFKTIKVEAVFSLMGSRIGNTQLPA